MCTRPILLFIAGEWIQGDYVTFSVTDSVAGEGDEFVTGQVADLVFVQKLLLWFGYLVIRVRNP